MRPVYAFSCTVLGDPETTFSDLVLASKQWVTSKYKRLIGPDFCCPEQNYFSPMQEHWVETRSQSGKIGQILSLELRHPGDNDTTLGWSTVVRFCTNHVNVEAQVILSIKSNEQIIRPASYDPMPPRIVSDLVSHFDCQINGRPLWKSVENISDNDIEKFVERDLLDPERRIPLIVVSRLLDSERPVIAGDDVRRPVVGLANVAVLNDKYAAFRLSELIGRSRSCWNGAIAVYWPGIDINDLGARQLFLADEILRDQVHRPFTKTLFRVLAPVSTFRNVGSGHYDDLNAALRDEVNAGRSGELERLKNDMRGRTSDNDFYQKYAEEVDKDRIRLRNDNQQLADDNHQLNDRIQALQENFRLFSSTVTAQDNNSEDEPEAYLATVHDALKRAGDDFADKIEVWKTAWDSASDSHFKDPAEVYAALEAIAQLVGLDGAWDKHFEQRNFKHSVGESQNTRNMYGKERWCRDKGREQHIERHLTLGGADRENCLQIYFDRTKDSDKIVIGYCGVHKRYYSQGT